MKTAIVRIGGVVDAQKHRERFRQLTQANLGAISPEQGTKRAFGERRRHEEWEQRIEEGWQSQFERLQQYVCELLLKNQQLRMALMAADERDRIYRDAVNPWGV